MLCLAWPSKLRLLTHSSQTWPTATGITGCLTVLLTHGHFDHCLGALDLKLIYNVPFGCSEKDKFLLDRQGETAKHFLKKQIQVPNFIKIDVEGNELKTLRGAKKTIEKFKPTLMAEIEQRHHTEPVWDIISEIEDWGFDANYLDRNSLTLRKLEHEFLEEQNSENVKNYKQYINNIIFVPRK